MKLGNSGMTIQEFRATYNGPEVQAQRQMNKNMNCANNIAKLQQTGAMYGLNLDTSSVFQIADTNGDGYISNKEATTAMGTINRMAQMNALNGAMQTQSSGGGGSNVFGMLNNITDVAGNIFGGETNASANSGGNIIQKGIDFLGGLFG